VELASRDNWYKGEVLCKENCSVEGKEGENYLNLGPRFLVPTFLVLILLGPSNFLLFLLQHISDGH
jgi:hypothetical protein